LQTHADAFVLPTELVFALFVHVVHIEESKLEKVPKGQIEQVNPFPKYPAGHTHEGDARLKEGTLTPSQILHVVLPVSFWYVPVGQAKQLDRPDVLEKKPTGLNTHADPVPQDPMGQGTHDVPFRTVPVLQAVHVADPATDWELPEQLTHDKLPEENVLAGQTVQLAALYANNARTSSGFRT
jgi:hypothetical protein